MPNQTKNELFSVRLDPRTKADASEILSSYGLNLSDAVRMFLTRIIVEKRLPPGLTMDEHEYDDWFRKKVHEALSASGPKHSHESVISNVEAAINRTIQGKGKNA